MLRDHRARMTCAFLLRDVEHPRSTDAQSSVRRAAMVESSCMAVLSVLARIADIRRRIYPFRATPRLRPDAPEGSTVGGARVDAVLFDLDRTLARFDIRRLPELLHEMCRVAHTRLTLLGHRPPRLDRYFHEIAFRFAMAGLKSLLYRREVPLVDSAVYGHARMQVKLSRAGAIELCRLCVPLVFDCMTVDAESVGLLAQLGRRGYKLGLVSNTLAPHFVLDDYLASVGLLEHLPVRVYSSDTGYMKPHREIFRAALTALGTDAAHCVFVGDKMRTDIKGATRMGMTTILLSPHGKQPHGRVQPMYVVQRLSEIPELLAKRGRLPGC